ncbi:MAG TPA: hypothetical protein VMZ25_08200 [Terriglobales bacterium]|nr:hypothetical protein [Terriglobales bacterium]
MPRDMRELAKVLQSELIFLEAGGYSAWAGARWRLPLIFEESPTCPNFNDTSASFACKNCAMFRLVPLQHQGKMVPCRHIPLNELGETLDSLYRGKTMEELQPVLRQWLIRKINELQAKQSRLDYLRQQKLYDAADPT